MSDLGKALDDAAKAYQTACKDVESAQAAFREANAKVIEAERVQADAESRKSLAGRFLRLVAEHGPVEDWGRDYMQDGMPVAAGQLVGSVFQNYPNSRLTNALTDKARAE